MPHPLQGPEMPLAHEYGLLPDLVMHQLQKTHEDIAHTGPQLCTEIHRKAIIKHNPVRAWLQLELRTIDSIRRVYTPMKLKVLNRDHNMKARHI
jgi:hypothetical protein